MADAFPDQAAAAPCHGLIFASCGVSSSLCRLDHVLWWLFLQPRDAVLVALFLKWLFSRVLDFLGERFTIRTLMDDAQVSRVSWILAAVTTGYLCFLR